LFEGRAAIISAATNVNIAGAASVLYLAIPATLQAFWIWARLVERYSPQTVAPFSPLVPVFGMASARLAFGEHIGWIRLTGMLLVICGLAILVIPARLRVRLAGVGDKTAATSGSSSNGSFDLQKNARARK
jgi:O-acetylserine/cysteine efflux transporter